MIVPRRRRAAVRDAGHRTYIARVARGKGADEWRDTPPEAFERLLAQVRSARLRPEIVVEETPAPQRLAPWAVALSADVVVDEEELATGRLVLLHDPAGQDAWQGRSRLVVYARATLENDIAGDPLLASVAWTWLTEALAAQGAAYLVPSGSVTVVTTESFGTMREEPVSAQVEIRASWTPVDGAAVEPHVVAWGELLCAAAGLPPLPHGVVPLPGRRGSRGR